MTNRRVRVLVGLAGGALAAQACTAGEPASQRRSPEQPPGATTTTPSMRTAAPPQQPKPRQPPHARVDGARAMRDVRLLAGGIGPREATSRAYARAVDLVADRFADLGYEVTRQRLRVPSGVSWGVPVGS